MSYESTAEPIKVGYLMDFKLPDYFPQEMRDDFTAPFDLVFGEALEQGIMDRPVQMIYREVEGLPKGTVKAVIDAYGELVDEGCLVVFGPHITDNAVPTREAIEERFRVPAVSVTGSDDWLGEWTFSFPQGSLTDEPIFWADLLAKGGHKEVGVLFEQSLVGQTYLKNFQKACRHKGIRIVIEAPIAQTAQDVSNAVRTVYEAKADAIVHCGFGFGSVMINSVIWNAFLGWTGIDQYDEGNPIGQRFLDQYQKTYGRRPEYCVPVVNRDVATTLVRAFTDAHPLSPRGGQETPQRIKDPPRRIRRTGHQGLVRELDPPRLDGRRVSR